MLLFPLPLQLLSLRAYAECTNLPAPGATYADGRCVSPDLTDACAGVFDWTDLCPRWPEVAWHAAWRHHVGGWAVEDCVAGSAVAHTVGYSGGGVIIEIEFDWSGDVVGSRRVATEGGGWCCDDRDTEIFDQGSYGGLCIEGDDPLDALPPTTDGCAAAPTLARFWPTAIVAVAILLAARRRPGRASPRSGQAIVTTTVASRRT